MSNSSSGGISSDVNSLKDIATGQVQLDQSAQNIASNVINAGSNVYNEGSGIYNTALGQYDAGVAGQLTPAQTALVSQNLATTNAGTQGTYGNLGLGGSTMEGQDLGNNQLRSEAENANIAFGNESLGLEGLKTADTYYNTGNSMWSTGDQYLNTAESALSGAATSVSDAGKLSLDSTSQLNSAISSLGNKSGSGLSNLFSSSGGSGLGSLLSSSGGSAAAGSGVSDAATGLISFA